ncbi:MAG: VOC family protein [Thiotrichales bacterium]
MNTNPVAWFEIYVPDMNRAKAFYESVFQCTLSSLQDPTGGDAPTMEMWAFPMSDQGYGAAGTLVKMEGVPSGGNSTLVYFGCEDCAVEAARAAANGGALQQEKMAIGEHGFIALVKDTEGNMIGLHSMT